ncbi:MAG: hypothetical protein AB1611_21170 [bacterium]
MKNFCQFLLFIIILTAIMLIPSAQAQVSPFSSFPNLFFCPFAYCPFLPPPLPLAAPATDFGRYAHAPLTTASLFPAPVLPTAPAATVGGVGVTSLIPTVSIAATVPASLLVTNPLAPLITYTPLSLVGLTYAPVPAPALPVSIAI